MMNRLLHHTIVKPSDVSKPKCPTCHKSLELPPRLAFLERSDKARYITFNDAIDRTVLSCRHCAYRAAKTAASEVTSPLEIENARKVIEDKLRKATELIYGDDLDEPTRERLRVQKPKWQAEIYDLLAQERTLQNFIEMKNMMIQASDLIDQGICVKELKAVVSKNQQRRAEFEIEWEKKGWMPYWAIWGWDGEMSL